MQNEVVPDKALNKKLALYLWDTMISLATARHVILFGVGTGAQAITDLVSARRKLAPHFRF